MSTEKHRLAVGGLSVEVAHKAIKNMHLGVYPPLGRVRVAAPLAVNKEAVRLAIITKMGWIKRQKAKFEAQARESRREMVNGESHYYLGRRYRLQVIERKGPNKMLLQNNHKMVLQVRPGTSAEKRRQVLQDWYRTQIKTMIPRLLAKWEPIVGVHANEWKIKRMKTKWGSCNKIARRIWLNLELVKKPPICLEYILVHELVHLLERHHNGRFHELMDKFMPRWKFHRDELKREPLAYEHWDY